MRSPSVPATTGLAVLLLAGSVAVADAAALPSPPGPSDVVVVGPSDVGTTRSSAAPPSTRSTDAPAVPVVPMPGATGPSDRSDPAQDRFRQTASGSTALVPLEPCRLLDTRRTGAVGAGATTTVDVTAGSPGLDGRGCGVPADAAAIAATITLVDPVAAGHATVWGEGEPPPTSTVNVDVGRTTANSTIVSVGSDGRIRVRADVETHLLVDVAGAFVPTASSTSGRFVPIDPTRVLDTRGGDGPVGGGDAVTVPLHREVPTDAIAVAANVTVVDAAGVGHVTVHAAGTPAPEASIANLHPGATVASTAVVPVDEQGLAVTVSSSGHLIVDITGWFTGPTAPESDRGLFVPIDPARLHDSRDGRRTLDAGGTREVVADADASAWALNITATGGRADGYLTAFPARTPRPGTSSVNAPAGETVANAALSPISERGLSVYASAPTDVIVDAVGWFTGSPVTATTEAAPDLVAPRQVLVVSDSVGAEMRWTADARTALRGAEFTTDLQSCRRLAVQSCRGREGFVPSNAVTAIRRQPAGAHDTLVMATGYNDTGSDFETAFERVNEAARQHGFTTIVWVTMSEDIGPGVPSWFRDAYGRMNRTIRAGADAAPDLEVMDWQAFTAGRSGWVLSDGLHLTSVGAYGMADMISRTIASLDGAPCPMPWAPGLAADDPCPRPDGAVAGERGLPDVTGLYR